jgi:hypothetical protein
MARLWSETSVCLCGRRFRVGSSAEAQHRHAFPALCRAKRSFLDMAASPPTQDEEGFGVPEEALRDG